MSANLSVITIGIRRLRLLLVRRPAVRIGIVGLAGVLFLLGAWLAALGLLALLGAVLRSPWVLFTSEIALAVYLLRTAPKSTPAVYLVATAVTAWVVNDPASFRTSLTMWLLLTVVFALGKTPVGGGPVS